MVDELSKLFNQELKMVDELNKSDNWNKLAVQSAVSHQDKVELASIRMTWKHSQQVVKLLSLLVYSLDPVNSLLL